MSLLSATRLRARVRRGALGPVAIIAAGLLLSACKAEKQVQAPAAQPVQVMRLQPSPAEASWSYVGVVRPRTETDLGFRVGGKITERLVEVGQTVEEGQVIARLDPTDFRLSLEMQQAELAAALSSREQAVAAEARFRTLLQQGHVAKAALEQRTATADEARSRVDRAERALALARNQLAYAELKADRRGVVSTLPVEVGQVVAAGQAVARISHRNGLEAEVAIPEHMIAAVKAATATAEIWGVKEERIPARLRELSPEADRNSRTFRARFTIEQPAAVELGRTVTVHLARRGAETVVRVPLAALMSDGRGAAVWVVDSSGTRVRRTPVTVVSLASDHAVLAGGVTPGEQIVTLGVHMLDEAKPVRIIEQKVALY